ncbi:hypothetical protein [Romboutsia sp.]|uniref:hypothetical protein n=1 Tax=Romboutsia sp. TaxID=1965302 RepID=UPI002B6AB3F4|nr:hypothetical protein [Romboutsia sp.]HSQ87596.1 hypothetical protein [Romboutsia sp.]
MVKGLELNIVEGDYVADIDQYVIKLDDQVTLSSGDYIYIPSYAKDPNIWFNVLDNTETLKIEGNKLIAVKEGTSAVGIMKNSRVLRKTNIKVIDPNVQYVEAKLDSKLEYVGDTAKIDSIVEVDYDKFKEKEKVTYKSSDKNIIKISGNKIEAIGVGKARVYAKAKDKEDVLEFNIKAKVSKIDINSKIEIEVGQNKKLNPNIITKPNGLKHPKIKYELVQRKLPIERAIRLDNDGTVVGLKEGEEKVKITCDNKSKIITVKVVKEALTNSKVQNLEASYKVINGKLQISLTWDCIEDVLDYDIYLRNNSLQERQFKLFESVSIKEENPIPFKKGKTIIEVDLIDGNMPNLSIYVVGKTKFGTTNPSNIINTKPRQDDIQNLEVKDLRVYIDEENNIAKFNWNPIDMDSIQYSIYIKNNLLQDGGFILLENAIEINEYIMNLEKGEIDIEIYVNANQGEKYSKHSNIVNIKRKSISEDS